MADKLTPWYPRNVQPARPGVYELKSPSFSIMRWSYFDGSHWNGSWSMPDWAAEEVSYFRLNANEGCATERTHWRGLAAKPKD